MWGGNACVSILCCARLRRQSEQIHNHPSLDTYPVTDWACQAAQQINYATALFPSINRLFENSPREVTALPWDGLRQFTENFCVHSSA